MLLPWLLSCKGVLYGGQSGARLSGSKGLSGRPRMRGVSQAWRASVWVAVQDGLSDGEVASRGHGLSDSKSVGAAHDGVWVGLGSCTGMGVHSEWLWLVGEGTDCMWGWL